MPFSSIFRSSFVQNLFFYHFTSRYNNGWASENQKQTQQLSWVLQKQTSGNNHHSWIHWMIIRNPGQYPANTTRQAGKGPNFLKESRMKPLRGKERLFIYSLTNSGTILNEHHEQLFELKCSGTLAGQQHTHTHTHTGSIMSGVGATFSQYETEAKRGPYAGCYPRWRE